MSDVASGLPHLLWIVLGKLGEGLLEKVEQNQGRCGEITLIRITEGDKTGRGGWLVGM